MLHSRLSYWSEHHKTIRFNAFWSVARVPIRSLFVFAFRVRARDH